MIYTLDRLTKRYATRQGPVASLDGLTLNIQEGEQVALIGRSGAGKTTLFRLLNATLRPTTGRLSFAGQDLGTLSGRGLRAVRRRIGTVYQQHYLVPSLSVMDNALCGRLGHWSLLHTLRNMITPAPCDAEDAAGALELVGLGTKGRARADQLSGGEQQRLAIARMLMQNPDVILADEPVASLDPTLTDSIMSLLVRLGSNGQRRTLIVALHDVRLALSFFPRIVGLRDGRVAFDEDARNVNKEMLDALYAGESVDGRETDRNTDESWCAVECPR
jgi:phosphonate transport system ATP-binding protein